MYFSLFVESLCLSLFCYALLCGYFSFAIILKRKRKLVALLLLTYRCIVTINGLWLFLAVPWVGLQSVIVVFPEHTHFLRVLTNNLIFLFLNKNICCGNSKEPSQSFVLLSTPKKLMGKKIFITIRKKVVYLNLWFNINMVLPYQGRLLLTIGLSLSLFAYGNMVYLILH